MTKIATRPKKSAAADARGLVIRRYGSSGRSYTLDGVKLVSVSKVKEAFPKNLQNWAAREERALILRELEGFLYDNFEAPAGTLTPSGIVAAVLERIGEKHAWVSALNRAGNVGTSVHSAIEWYCASMKHKAGDGPNPGAPPELTDELAARSFSRFCTWAADADFMPIASEVSVCSPSHKWGGTLDELAFVAGRVGVIDWKTPGRPYLADLCQVAAYFHGYNEFEDAQVRGVPRAESAWMMNFPKKAEDPEALIRELTPYEVAHYYETFLLAVPFAYRLEAYEAERKAAAAILS